MNIYGKQSGVPVTPGKYIVTSGILYGAETKEEALEEAKKYVRGHGGEPYTRILIAKVESVVQLAVDVEVV